MVADEDRPDGELLVMRLLRRSVSGEISHALEPRRAPRGAWYPDPFGTCDERWWDGGQWTREVRTAAEAERAALSPELPTSRRPLDRSPRAETPESSSADLRASDFPVGIEAVVGEQLSVVPSPRKPGMHCQVLALRGRVGSISLFGRQMARLTCAHGAWFLKSRRGARGFRIESVDHRNAGRYLRRHWMPGGTIRLTDGTEVKLRRSLPGRWEVRSADGGGCLAEIHRSVVRASQPPRLKLTIRSLPADAADASVLMLAACALLMLPADAA